MSNEWSGESLPTAVCISQKLGTSRWMGYEFPWFQEYITVVSSNVPEKPTVKPNYKSCGDIIKLWQQYNQCLRQKYRGMKTC